MESVDNLFVRVMVRVSQSAQYLIAGFVLQGLIMHPEFGDDEFPSESLSSRFPIFVEVIVAVAALLVLDLSLENRIVQVGFFQGPGER